MIDAGATPVVPGLVLDAELGRGRFGRLWRAVDLGTGEAVAVRVGRPAGGADAVARNGALLRRLRHENVARLRSVVDLPNSSAPQGAGGWASPGRGARALVLDLVPGGSLAALAARRGALPPGEVATVAVGVARALAHLHAHGLVHGRLIARDVLFDAQGRPVVTDVGVAALLEPAAGDAETARYASPADDVLALGRLLRDALAPGGPLTDVVAACLAPDPAARPTPDRIAQLAARAVQPQPVDLSAAAQVAAAPTPARPGWRPLPGRPPAPHGVPVPPATHLAHPVAVPSPAPAPAPVQVPARARVPASSQADAGKPRVRRFVVAAGIVLAGGGLVAGLVAGAFALALRTGGGSKPARAAPSSPAVSPSVSPSVSPAVSSSVSPAVSPPVSPPVSPSVSALSDVAAVVGRLAAARARAFSSASDSALGSVDAPGSAALQQDREFVRRLRAAGVRLEGLRFTVGDVQLVAATGDDVTVQARVAASAYRQVRPDGTLARAVAAQAPRRVQLTLVRVGGDWRVSAVV